MGRRLCVWLPAGDVWMVETLDALVAAAEARGVGVTRSGVLREVLRKGLENYYAGVAPDSEKGRVVGGGVAADCGVEKSDGIT